MSRRKMELHEAVLVRKTDPDRLDAIEAYKTAILKLMKKGEWMYLESGTPRQGAKGL